MAEQLDLTAPQVHPQTTTSTFSITFIGLYRVPTALVVVHLLGTQGERIEIRTDTPGEGQTLLSQLNNANLSVKSLQKRALEWCASKRPELAGNVSGTPD